MSTPLSGFTVTPRVDAYGLELKALKDQSNGFLGHEDLCRMVEKYGFGALTEQGIAEIAKHTGCSGKKIVGVFSGRGYVEKQLAEAGFDVVAFDIQRQKNPWLPEIGVSNYPIVTAYPDRALLMSFPDGRRCKKCIASEAVRLYARAGGQRLILITPGSPATLERVADHPLAPHRNFDDFMSRFNRLSASILHSWPAIGYCRTPISSLHTLLEIFDVTEAATKH